MITELAGYSLTKTIPDKHLIGILTGVLKICGGVIRNTQGHIVGHLVDGVGALSAASPINAVLEGVNTFQIYRIGKNVGALKESVNSLQATTSAIQAATSSIATLSKATMLMSGLTLAVCAAGFIFLNRKLSKINEKLIALQKDVKEIKAILQLQERGKLMNALTNLAQLGTAKDNARTHILVSSRDALGEIKHTYHDLLMNVGNVTEVLAIEEYYTLTALGHAMCSTELDMIGQAAQNLEEDYLDWKKSSKRVANDLILKNEPERLMERRYGGQVKTHEIIDWLDFSKGTDRGLDWVDEFRTKATWLPDVSTSLSKNETAEIDVMRKYVSRDRVYEGYVSQYRFLNERSLRPSELEAYYKTLHEDQSINGDCHLFMAN